ncbi:MAG: HAMP domain-containing sensor histidine kinase [Chloroflexota bacterium]
MWLAMSSIRWRLALLYTFVFATSALISDALIYAALETFLLREVDENLASQAQEINGTTSVQVVGTTGPGLGPVAFQVNPPNVDVFASPGLFVQLVNSDADILVRSSNLGDTSLPVDRRAVARVMSRRVELRTEIVGGSRVRVLYAPIDPAPRIGDRALGVVQVGRALSEIEGVLGWLKIVVVVVGAITLAVAVAAGWWLSTVALRPIDRLTRGAREIGERRDFARRVAELPPRDEVGRLAATFNEMLDRLQEAYQDSEQALESQRRFVADASHELRTPLATIRMNLDLLQRAGEALSRSDREEAMADALAEIERLSRLVGNLLTLARADSGLRIDRLKPVALDRVVEEVFRQARLLALAKQHRVQLDLDGPIGVMGDADYLKEMLLILVDNAVRYTPAEGAITLGARLEGGHARAWVSDSGEGIDPRDLPHVFDRFYRADPSRTRSAAGDRDGTGLGLAIARWIVEEHGGTIVVQSSPHQGTTFVVSLPSSLLDARQPAPARDGVAAGAVALHTG